MQAALLCLRSGGFALGYLRPDDGDPLGVGRDLLTNYNTPEAVAGLFRQVQLTPPAFGTLDELVLFYAHQGARYFYAWCFSCWYCAYEEREVGQNYFILDGVQFDGRTWRTRPLECVVNELSLTPPVDEDDYPKFRLVDPRQLFLEVAS
jgi:hypothetical protein